MLIQGTFKPTVHGMRPWISKWHSVDGNSHSGTLLPPFTSEMGDNEACPTSDSPTTTDGLMLSNYQSRDYIYFLSSHPVSRAPDEG